MSRPPRSAKATDVRATAADDRDRGRQASEIDHATFTRAPPSHTCPRCGFVGQMAAPPPPAEALRIAPRYRVIKGGTFSWRGAVCNVQRGDTVLLRCYGAAGIETMRGRGIVLEPLPE